MENKLVPMFVESLMTPEEWHERMLKYPTSSSIPYRIAMRSKPHRFKWRFRMGENLSKDEIIIFNERIEYLKRHGFVKPKT